MTEHGKARKNRKRDLEAHHAHVHDYDRQAIAAGLVVVNASPVFKNPLRLAVTRHTKPPTELIEMVASQLNSVTMSSGSSSTGLDAKCLVAISMDNVDWAGSDYYTRPPAPQVGSPIHWDSFIQRICDLYRARFG